MRMKKGDTLIEVALAIGIFSMVAVSVVSVVSASTSDAQSSLETTVTREEIDAQAEALRFIQSAYISGGYANVQGDNMQKYAKIWQRIVEYAVEPSGVANAEFAEKVLRFNPETCSEIYTGNGLAEQGAFIINTRKLGSSDSAEIVVRAIDTPAVFATTATYPRLLYGASGFGAGTEPEALLNMNPSANLLRAEGLFIVPVQDPGSAVVSGSSAQVQIRSAYYDFYIRSCWYNPGATKPSTIATVVRLQDPTAIEYTSDAVISKRAIISFMPGDDSATGYMPTQSISSGTTKALVRNRYQVAGKRFLYWVDSATGLRYGDGENYAVTGLTSNKSVTLTAVWGNA